MRRRIKTRQQASEPDGIDWFKRKFEWVEAIAEDPTISRLAFAIAYKFAWRYFNADKKYAWPGIDTLAAQLNTTPRSVRRALDQLIAAGKLKVQQGGRGAHDTNHYWMRDSLKGDVEVTLAKGDKGDVGVRRRVTLASNKGDAGVSRILRENPMTGTRGERARARPLVFEFGKKAPAKKHIPAHEAKRPMYGSKVKKHIPAQNKGAAFPDEDVWQCGVEEENTAADIAGWDQHRAVAEFGKFRDHHLAAGNLRADWSAAWRKWCRMGVDIDQRSHSRKGSGRPTGMASMLIGLREGLEQDQPAEQDQD